MSAGRSDEQRAAALVARRGICLGSAHADRSANGSRFPEAARKAAQTTVRSALRRLASEVPEGEKQ